MEKTLANLTWNRWDIRTTFQSASEAGRGVLAKLKVRAIRLESATSLSLTGIKYDDLTGNANRLRRSVASNFMIHQGKKTAPIKMFTRTHHQSGRDAASSLRKWNAGLVPFPVLASSRAYPQTHASNQEISQRPKSLHANAARKSVDVTRSNPAQNLSIRMQNFLGNPQNEVKPPPALILLLARLSDHFDTCWS